MRIEVAVLEIYHHMLHQRIGDARRLLADAEALPHVESSLGAGYLHFIRSALPSDPLNPLDINARVRSLQVSAEIFERIGHAHGVVETLYVQFFLKRLHFDLPGALASSVFLEGFASRNDRTGHHVVHDCLMFRGELLYLQNRIPEAREVFLRVASIPAYDTSTTGNIFFARAYLMLCDAAESPDPAAALRSLDELSDAVQWTQILDSNSPSICGIVAWPRILRDSRAGRPERCRQTAESLRLTLADLSDQMHDMLRFAVLAGAVLGEDDSPQLDEQLDAFLSHARATHSHYLAAQVRILRTLHALTRGDRAAALAHLREALPDVERSGALRLLLDFPSLRPLLRRCDAPFARQLLALYPADASPTRLHSLTDQEARILAQLAAGLSTKELAAAHSVTAKTIYAHIHSIFNKLDVRSRKEAVRMWQGSRK